MNSNVRRHSRSEPLTHSWTIEDVRDLNPPDSPQEVSFLDRLLAFSSTTEGLLVEFAEYLERHGGPVVAAFGQLPFDLGLGSVQLGAPGDRPGSTVELWVRPLQVSLDEFGSLQAVECSEGASVPHATITQLVGVVRLGDKRQRVHPLYVSRLGSLKLLNSQLGSHMVETWMRLPDASLQEPQRRRRPLTGIDFQRDVAERVREHLRFATRALLNAYSIAALVDVRDRWFLHGYHAMVAPGRLAGVGLPVPVVRGLIRPPQAPNGLILPLGDLKDTVRTALRAEDPYVRRLQALHALCINGEPELALVGAFTALEWFLNHRFPDIGLKKQNGQTLSGSVRDFLRSGHAKLLPSETAAELHELVQERNRVTHGPPLTHGHRMNTASTTRAQKAMRVALETYRLVNIANAT